VRRQSKNHGNHGVGTLGNRASQPQRRLAKINDRDKWQIPAMTMKIPKTKLFITKGINNLHTLHCHLPPESSDIPQWQQVQTMKIGKDMQGTGDRENEAWRGRV
jgi:hypothetical protein